MPGIISPSVYNVAIPKGFMLFTPTNPAGAQVQLGNITKWSYTPAVEIKPHFTEQLGTKLQDFSAILQKGGSVKATLEERTAFNMGLFFNGSINYTNPDAVSVGIYNLPAQIQGSAQFVGTNDVGPRWLINLTNLLIAPSGDFEMILDDWAGTIVTMTHIIDQNFTFGTATLLPAANSIAPENYQLPYITGPLHQGDIPAFAKVGEIMTCNIGTWVLPQIQSLTFEWFGNASPIAGATNQTYTPTVHDEGNTLTCEVTATNPIGTTSATSGPTLPVHA
jgi:hypothetical protein